MFIKIKKSVYNKCHKFATQRVLGSSKLYGFRGENNKDKLLEDIIVGALGEFAVYSYLTSKGIECSKPDLSIKSKKDKSYSADLVFNLEGSDKNELLHVKSQSVLSSKKYGDSWLFQKTDPLYRNKDNNELLVFTNVDLETNSVFILGFCRASDIHKSQKWGQCKVFSFRHSKVALYFEDLKDLLIEF